MQQIDPSYDVVEVPNAPRKNCTASGGNCIPKCFAEKGNRGFPGIPGLPGPKGSFQINRFHPMISLGNRK